MSTQPTYRSIVRDLVAVIEREHGNDLSGNALDAALGPLAEVYRGAKALMADAQSTPTMFVSVGERGAYATSTTDVGLDDVNVVIVDETIHDKDGSLISIGHVDGTVFTATVKMLLPSEVHFDADRVNDVAKRLPYRNGKLAISGIDRAIDMFSRWADESRPFHHHILQKAYDAISENGIEAYSDFLTESRAGLQAGLLSRARKHEPDLDEAATEKRLLSWMDDNLRPDQSDAIIVAAIYERGVNAVQQVFEAELVHGPSI